MSQNSQRRPPNLEIEIGGHDDDPVINSSINQIERFQDDNIVWRDIKNWLEDRISILQTYLETAETVEEMREYQGAISNARDVLNLPNQLIEELERDTED